MTTERGEGVTEEVSDEVQIVNATAEQIVVSNSLLVKLILDNLTVKDLKRVASTSFTFYSEAVKLLDKKSKIDLWSENYQSYFESFKKGGRIPNRSIVGMSIGTPKDYLSSIPSTPKRCPNIGFEIIRRIGGDKVRFLDIHVETTKPFFAKMRKLLSLAVNLDELEIYFKNVYHCDTNFVAALPFDDTFQLPNLKLSFSMDEMDNDGQERIRIFLNRLISASQNLETFDGNGVTQGVQSLTAKLFLEELAKIPGRMEKMNELSFRPSSSFEYGTQVFNRLHRNFVGLHIISLSVTRVNVEEVEEILENFKKSSALTKLQLFLGNDYWDDNDDDEEGKLKIPVMENLEKFDVWKNMEIDDVDVVIKPSAGVFKKLWRLEISVALIKEILLSDPNQHKGRFPSLTHICYDEMEEKLQDDMREEILNFFPNVSKFFPRIYK